MMAARVSSWALAPVARSRVFQASSILRRNLMTSRVARAGKYHGAPPRDESTSHAYRDILIVGGVFAAGIGYAWYRTGKKPARPEDVIIPRSRKQAAEKDIKPAASPVVQQNQEAPSETAAPASEVSGNETAPATPPETDSVATAVAAAGAALANAAVSAEYHNEENVPFEQLQERLQRWKQQGPFSLVVGVDVGGTNVRVAFGRVESKERFVLRTFKNCDTVEELCEILNRCGDVVKAVGLQPHGSAICVAGPKDSEGVNVTNYRSGHQRLPQTSLPQTLFPGGRIALLNDLQATGYGLIALRKRKAISGLFAPLDTAGPAELLPGPILVIACGTGLGVALIAPVGDEHFVLPLEGGHSLVTPLAPDHPDRIIEENLLIYMSRMLWNGKHNIEYEDLCSGRGLKALYAWVTLYKRGVDVENISVPQIGTNAELGDQDAMDALNLYYRYQMRLATNLGLTFRPSTIVLAGDNQVRNNWLLMRNASEYRDELVSAPRGKDWLGDVPILVQTVKTNINIEGAMLLSEDIAAGGGLHRFI